MGLKSNVWRGVSASAGLLLGLVFLLGNLAIDRQTDVNLFLGTTAPKTSGTGDALYFKSSYASAQEVVAAEKDHNIRMQEEASVLLKNKANALPLKSSERRVSLFGRAVADPVYRGQSGGAAFSGTSFHDALTGEGFAINETLFSAYQSSKTSRVTTSYEAVIAGSSPRSTIGEETSSFYTAALQASYATDYNDAAIVMFSRTAGEGKDLAKVDADGVAQLSLHQSEKDLLLMLKSSKDAGQIKKIIVLINSAFPMDLGFLEDDATYGVDAALSIGNPGNYGFIGVADILVGKADPSGHLADTYSANSLSSPAMQNFGDYTFSGMTGLYKNKYVVCAEGLYVGYKYYESRYADSVMARGNASGNYGVFAAGKTSWDYADEMVYPFGYGTSYASFQQTLKSLEWDRDAHQVKAVVNVKNVSSSTYSGKSKDVVELYVSLPYTEGGAEKSAIQLVDFAKSSALGVGEEEDITFTTSDYMFATYDNQATNGKDTSKKGCYTFDSGDYLFAIGSDAHDALNNTLSLAGYSGLKNADGTSVSGDSSLAKKVTLDVLDNVTYAVSPYTGAVVSNQFDDIDLNHFIPNKAPFFSRKDYASFPKETSTIDPSEEIKKLMENDNYTKPASSPEISAYKYGQTVTKKWIEMKDVPLSGEYTAKDGTKADGATSWDSFVDQLSVAELCQIAGEVMIGSIVLINAIGSGLLPILVKGIDITETLADGTSKVVTLGTQYNPQFYNILVPITVVVSAIYTAMAVLAIWNKDRPEFWGVDANAKAATFKDYLHILRDNSQIRWLVLSSGFNKLASTIATSGTVAYLLYDIMMKQSGSSYNGLYLPVYVLSFVFMGVFFVFGTKTASAKGQKRAIVQYTAFALLFYVGLMVMLFIWDPSNPDKVLTLLRWDANHKMYLTINLFTVIWIILYGCGYGAYNCCSEMCIPMVADCTDYETYRSGNYVPGIMSGKRTLLDKTAM